MRRIEEVKAYLKETLPEYSYSLGKRLLGECIIAKNTKYSGADIFVKEDQITIEAALPEMKTRILLGSGVLFLKIFSKKFKEPSLKIHYYLTKKYPNVKRRI